MDRVQLVDAACRRTAYRVRILEQGGIDGRPLENPQHISVQQGHAGVHQGVPGNWYADAAWV